MIRPLGFQVKVREPEQLLVDRGRNRIEGSSSP